MTREQKAWSDSLALRHVAKAAGVTDLQARKVLAAVADLRAAQVIRMIEAAHRIETAQ